MAYWNRTVETMPREDIEQLQVQRLRTTIARALQSPHYGAALARAGIGPDSINHLDDLRRIPFTTKDTLRDNYPYGLLAVGREEIVRMHSSSGTTGRPTVIFHTAADIQSWADLIARCMFMTGVRPADVFQNMMGYGLFTGGIGFHYGAERLGAMVIPAGPGNTQRQIMLMREFATTVIHIIPSYALHFMKALREQGIDPRQEFQLRIAFLGAEPHSEQTRQRIENGLGLQAYNSYGLSEMNGPGVAFECPCRDGMHVWEDSYILEVIDPETLDPVPDGQTGELVFTTLGRAGMPVLRYRSKDLAAVCPEPCPCGRTHRRITRITGRTDDMLIVKGVNMYPVQIETVLMAIPEVGANYQILLDRKNDNDHMTIRVEVSAAVFTGRMESLETLRRRIVESLRSEILITPTVELIEPDTLPKSDGKAVRVVDTRSQWG